MKTTLNKIRQHDPCDISWGKLLKSLDKTEADDTEVSIEYILDLLGLNDALWALRAVEGKDKEIRLLACDYAEHVLHIFEEKYPEDRRPRNAIGVSRKYANGNATKEDFDAAWVAARAAWYAAAACYAAGDDRAAARAAWYAAGAACYAAGDDRDAACDADRAAAWAAGDARDAEKQWQEQKLREYLNPNK